MNIYIASSEKYVGKIQEDVYMRDTYRNKGFSCEIVTLKNIAKISKPFDVVILKSIWGYNLDYETFLDQISTLKKKGIKLINDYQYIFWNIDKSIYLSEINLSRIVPTYKLNIQKANSVYAIEEIILLVVKNDTNIKFVIKPAVSASGYATFIYDKINPSKNDLSWLLKHNELNFIIQPFRSEIADGEISVVLIKGEIKYAIKRFPGIFTEKKDPEYVDVQEIPRKIIDQTKLILKFFIKKFECLPKICRIDFVKHNQIYEIMEIELIDPDLFFRNLPEDILEKCLVEICDTPFHI